jgi:hypothetical protein
VKALISRKDNKVTRVTGWTMVPYEGVSELGITEQLSGVHQVIPNALRIAEVTENEFSVHPDLFWVECNSSVNANDYYYDESDSTIKPINNVAPTA